MMRCAALWISLVLFASLGACTAWNYDIGTCDPNARDLYKDVCNQLNTNPSDCMLYQCDGSSSSCKLSARDFDRDGDADVACGGSDCNDYDPAIYGREGSQCTCKPELIDTECSAGQANSACVRKSKYLCLNNQLFCPAQSGAPQSWQVMTDPLNNSWDWDCDGNVQQSCSYLVAGERIYSENCATTMCSATILDEINKGDSQTICSNFCATLTSQGKTECNKYAFHQQEKIYNCDGSCGTAIAICFCIWNQTGIFPGTCNINSPSTMGSVYCK